MSMTLMAACGSIEIPTSSTGCQSDEDCPSETLCVEQVCTASAEDTDLDGLTNGVEAQLGTDPSRVDTDGDGVADNEEVGEISAPVDTDGDGLIDALESADGDADSDCISDQFDADDASDTAVEKKLELCQLQGVCAGDVEPKAECAPASNPADEPTWFCSYGGVVGYNPGPDALCDGLDNDCDGLVDEDFAGAETTCGTGACLATGTFTCVEGVELDGCEPVAALALNDTLCDGVDDDCDGETDEEYVGPDAFCGIGACKRSGSTVCFNGEPTLDCIEGPPAADDATCDGIDDDCDEKVDEDFVGATTSCGSGGCATTGQMQCQDGVQIDDCVAGSGAPTDATCDGVDDDCDGETDEEYVPANPTTTCGVGACASSGTEVCVDGVVADTCVAATPAADDASCNGLDDDCNGETDEDFVSEETTCGTGACQALGVTSCSQGELADSCTPLSTDLESDSTCDGIDDNCNGETDEDYAAGSTTCGQGVCASEGYQTCEDGAVVDSCVTGEAPIDEIDASCDGLDQDCDGKLDEGFESESYACGDGECVALGETTCVEGLLGGTCVAPTPATEVDAGCDDLDQDCDGEVDEDFVSEVVACGAGVCAGSGVTSCQGGVVTDSCSEGEGLAVDASCDGVDNDCDGAFDEDYAPVEISCGVGVCTTSLMTSCVEGSASTPCIPLDKTDDLDASCNGLDDDCDGETDEGFVVQAVGCGVGACQATGNLACVDGAEVNTCTPTPPGPNDASCNGVDNDCDGDTDEDFVASATSCGVGVCAQSGTLTCDAGQVVDTCSPLEALGPDITCDGLDDDCDGTTDEDYVVSGSECGVGACASTGQRSCINGSETDTCSPGIAAEDDANCDGIYDNCDGDVDEGFVESETTCGVGKCGSTGSLVCVNGAPINTCTPGTAEPSDVTCDGVDDNCNGQTDEDFVSESITCGLGACFAEGTRTCSNGAPVDNCIPGTPAASDATCDGVDDDCNGESDDGYVQTLTSCGDGACASTGELICSAGVETSTCVEVAPGVTDDDCDGVDDDCNGQTDDAYVPVEVTCGVGECARTGMSYCQGGNVLDDCQPGSAEPDDTSCDGKDNDCNGDTDEDFVSQTTSCGQGVCQSSGSTSCVDGEVEDSCEELPASAGDTDTLCDGLDSDCDGDVDEDFEVVQVSCGDGVCANTGQIGCLAAPILELNTCEPLTATATADYECNGLDDDCDGQTDEDYVPVQTQCGQGVCATTSMSICAPTTAGGTNNAPSDNCFPPLPSPTEVDASCNAQDDDCDGETDEGYVATDTTCGLGICASQGVLTCASGGVEADSCQPGPPVYAIDGTIAPDGCGGGDSDCDGDVDEDFSPTEITCGVGTCAETIVTTCTASGVVMDSCTPTAEPSCANKACGDDGCGGSCGQCAENEICGANFQCVCQPDCMNKACGGDGCGGSCGVCPTPDPCQVAQCGTDGTCSFSDLADWTSCDDGSNNTVGDFCASGRCIGFVHKVAPPTDGNDEYYVDASRRLGGGVHAVYTNEETNFAGAVTVLGGVEWCLNGAGCQSEIIGLGGSAQAISPSHLHIGGGLNIFSAQAGTLWRTLSGGYAQSGSHFQEIWWPSMMELSMDPVPLFSAINSSSEWVASAYLNGEGVLGLFGCRQTSSMCVHTGAPGGFKQTRPVRMRNWNGTGILAINDPGTDVGAYFSTDNGTSWGVLGIVDDPRSIEDFATVTDSDGVLIKVAVGEQGLIHWTRKEATGFIDLPTSLYSQNKLYFTSVTRLGDWLVTLAYDDASSEYVLAFVPWGAKVMESSQWGVMPTTLYRGQPASISFHQTDARNLYLYGSVDYEGSDARSLHHAVAHADTVLMDEDFGDGFKFNDWDPYWSCGNAIPWQHIPNDKVLAFEEGCEDPGSESELAGLFGALLIEDAGLGDTFTIEINVTAEDDDSYGLWYSMPSVDYGYRVLLNQEQGYARLEAVGFTETLVIAERTDVAIPVSEPANIKVQRIGPLHIVHLNDELLFQAHDDSLVPGPRLGLYTRAMKAAYFHDIRVTRPTVP